MEEIKETPSSPAAAKDKSDESYSQCMSPTPEERKAESTIAEDSQTATAFKETARIIPTPAPATGVTEAQ